MTNNISRYSAFTLSQNSFCRGGEWTPLDNVHAGGPDELYIKDSLSGAVYLNHCTDRLRPRLFLGGFLGGIVVNSLGLSINAVYRALKFCSFSHFWLPLSYISKNNESDGSNQLKIRATEWGLDFARILTTPFALIRLLFAGFRGIYNSSDASLRDNAKIYSSIEIAMYGGTKFDGHFAWQPSFQPEGQYKENTLPERPVRSLNQDS